MKKKGCGRARREGQKKSKGKKQKTKRLILNRHEFVFAVCYYDNGGEFEKKRKEPPKGKY